jgi:hypothetical protein
MLTLISNDNLTFTKQKCNCGLKSQNKMNNNKNSKKHIRNSKKYIRKNRKFYTKSNKKL